MDERLITCISCPVGCRLTVSLRADGGVSVSGNSCGRGVTYGTQEFTAPVRMVTSSARVSGGIDPLVSVRTKAPVPKEQIADVLRDIHALSLTAPVRVGDVLIRCVGGTQTDLIATRNC